MEVTLRQALILSCGLLTAVCLHGETGYDAWLRYSSQYNAPLPAVLATVGDSIVINSARGELIRGVRGMTGKVLREQSGIPRESAIVLGTLDRLPSEWRVNASLQPDAYKLKTVASGVLRYTVVTAANDRGVLYGAFALLRKMSLGESIDSLDETQSP